jgi:hypothetical protein
MNCNGRIHVQENVSHLLHRLIDSGFGTLTAVLNTYHCGLGCNNHGKVIGALAECGTVGALDAGELREPLGSSSLRTNKQERDTQSVPESFVPIITTTFSIIYTQ